jgi:hypothetical protein
VWHPRDGESWQSGGHVSLIVYWSLAIDQLQSVKNAFMKYKLKGTGTHFMGYIHHCYHYTLTEIKPLFLCKRIKIILNIDID